MLLWFDPCPCVGVYEQLCVFSFLFYELYGGEPLLIIFHLSVTLRFFPFLS